MNISIELITEAVLSGFLLGLSAGPLCMGNCLLILLPFSIGDSATHLDNAPFFKFIGKFLLGRFLTYIVFGLGIGYLGSLFQSTILNKIGVIAMMVLAVLLIAYGLGIKLPHHGFCKTAFNYSRSKKFPFILGILTGLNVCPPFLLAIFYSFERSTTPLFGMIFFSAFFFSTSLFLLPVLLVKYLPKGNYLMKISQITALIAGGYFIFKGISLLSKFTIKLP